MPAVTLTGFAHVRLTVSDVTRSRDLHEKVFGLRDPDGIALEAFAPAG